MSDIILNPCKSTQSNILHSENEQGLPGSSCLAHQTSAVISDTKYWEVNTGAELILFDVLMLSLAEDFPSWFQPQRSRFPREQST